MCYGCRIMKSLQALLGLFAFAFLPLNAASLADLTTNGKVTITDCDTAATGELVIPDTIGGNPVTSIGESAFRDCTILTSITIPDGVTSIGRGAFYNCSSLTSITIGNGVTSIGDFAFYDCNSLTSITLPDGVTSIGKRAFFNCIGLTSITIPDSLNSIGYGAFQDCSSLTSITFQGSAPNFVGSRAFQYLPGGAVAYVTIENQASFGGFGQKWNGLSVINSIDLIDLTWTTINGEVTVTDCNEAATGELVIPDTIGGNPVTSIGESAFHDCTSLTSITSPDSVTRIGSFAFYNCSALTSVIFQGDAPNVGNDLYSSNANGAVALVTIEALSSFGESGTYWNGFTIEPILTWTTTNGEVTITDCNDAATGELVIPDTIEGHPVTSIGEYAFQGCTSLTNITIPDGVTTIGSVAFVGCTSLTAIKIPDSVTSIATFAFWNCTSLTSITIPDSGTLIAGGTFQNCTSLTSITIPDQVTSISYDAFNGCQSLTSITIPDSVTSIGIYAFSSCSALTSIIFQGDAPIVDREAFTGVADGAVATVTIEDQASFGDLGADWNGLTVSMSVSDMITALNAQNAAVATARTTGQGDVTSDPASYGLVTQTSYDTVVAERDARPTAEQLATVEAERDARFNEDQIRNMSVDHTVGRNEAGNMQVKIAFVQSTDLNTYIPFTVIPDSLSVVDGKICMEFPPSDAENFFFRFGFHNPEPAIVVQ